MKLPIPENPDIWSSVPPSENFTDPKHPDVNSSTFVPTEINHCTRIAPSSSTPLPKNISYSTFHPPEDNATAGTPPQTDTTLAGNYFSATFLRK